MIKRIWNIVVYSWVAFLGIGSVYGYNVSLFNYREWLEDYLSVLNRGIMPLGLPLFYWKHPKIVNFGDYLSLKIVERMVGLPIQEAQKNSSLKKLLAVGSIMSFARTGDVIWGTGVKRKDFHNINYTFTHLDVRAVRGPLTRQFLMKYFNIECPEVYGDPALLIPYLFPEFKRKENPDYEYLIIPHYSDEALFPKSEYNNVAYPSDPWYEVIEKIVNSKFVISSSLHGIIIAEAFGIPARLLRDKKRLLKKMRAPEPIFKYKDYYYATGRPHFRYAFSVEDALLMGGEKPIVWDPRPLVNAFPFEFWFGITQ